LLGDLSDNHDIISVKVYELEAPAEQPGEDRSQIEPSSSWMEPARDHVEDPKPSSMSGVKMFFLLLLGLLGCVVCFVVGVMIYQKQQDNSRKRFY
jgi:mannose-binding lectin 2